MQELQGLGYQALAYGFLRMIFIIYYYLFYYLLFIILCRDVASGIDRHPDRTEIYFRLQIESSSLVPVLFTPHAQRERGKVIGRGVHIYIYIYIYVCGRKKNLNRTLEIDSPFQTLAVGLLVEFID